MRRKFIPQALSEAMWQAVERLLKRRTAVLVLMWMGGAALLGLCAMIVYWSAVALARIAVRLIF